MRLLLSHLLPLALAPPLPLQERPGISVGRVKDVLPCLACPVLPIMATMATWEDGPQWSVLVPDVVGLVT